MARTPADPLQTTPLHAWHRARGARMTPFGGWDMPLQYEGLAEEHRAVRAAAGLFDVSHGPHALRETRAAGRRAPVAAATPAEPRRLQSG